MPFAARHPKLQAAAGMLTGALCVGALFTAASNTGLVRWCWVGSSVMWFLFGLGLVMQAGARSGEHDLSRRGDDQEEQADRHEDWDLDGPAHVREVGR